MMVIPAVDVLDGWVVRLERGDYERVTVYGADPVSRAAAWQAAGAELVHVVDLAGARSGTHDPDLWRRLGAAGVRFQVGGGIRDEATAVAAVAAGAARVVIGTAAVWEPAVLAAMVDELGPERVVVALDVRGGRAAGRGWRESGRDLGAVVAGVIAAGADRALVTGIGRDGTLAGPDVDVLRRAGDLAPGLRLIASGGVGSLDDLAALAATPAVEAAIVGRALYDERFTLAEAIAAAG